MDGVLWVLRVLSRRQVVLGVLLSAAGFAGCQEETERPAADGTVLRVCADPNNLPFSNERLEGFENRLAEVVAGELNARVEYTWWAQRRGFLRNTLNAGACDVILGMPVAVEMALPTRPYYSSSYVFVSRRERKLGIRSLDDDALKRLRIGVQLVGDDGANSPPAHALTRRGIVHNVVGYSVYGDYGKENPPARIVEAVAAGEIDVALAWGPMAGYFAARQIVPLAVVPLTPQMDGPALPFVFDIGMAVRKADTGLRDRLDAVIARRQPEIDRILAAYDIPRVQPAGAEADSRRAARPPHDGAIAPASRDAALGTAAPEPEVP